MVGEIKELTAKEANDFILPRHYSGRKANVSLAYGWYINGEMKAAITFGKPASPSLCKGICGEEYAKNVYELNRLCRVDDLEHPLSSFVSAVLRRMKNKHWIVVSFADTAMNHHGYIYQACNFLYTGCTKERTDIYPVNGGHARHYTNADKDSGVRIVRSAKHRYVYFCTNNARERDEWFHALNYSVVPYPKGDNSADYVLGDYIQKKLVRK